jgi:hypothetical protein
MFEEVLILAITWRFIKLSSFKVRVLTLNSVCVYYHFSNNSSSAKYGQTASESADDALFLYGKALLANAVQKNASNLLLALRNNEAAVEKNALAIEALYVLFITTFLTMVVLLNVAKPILNLSPSTESLIKPKVSSPNQTNLTLRQRA